MGTAWPRCLVGGDRPLEPNVQLGVRHGHQVSVASIAFNDPRLVYLGAPKPMAHEMTRTGRAH